MNLRNFLVTVLGAIGAVIVFLVTWPLWFRRREDVAWQDAARPGKLVVVDGVAVHYLEKGQPDAPAIVMIHGFGGHTFSFRYQMAELERDYRVIAIDLKGFGYSERQGDAGDHSLTEQARLMLRTLDALGVEKTAALIGHSMGGEVAMRMAAAQPERFGKLVLAASVSGERVPSLPRIPIWRWFLPFWSRVIALNAWRKMFYDRSQVDTGAIRSAYLATARIQGSLDTVWAMWRDLRRDKKIAYGRIRQPVLVLWAEKEQIVPFAGRTLRKLREALPQAEVVIVPRTGHLLLEENPQAANEALRRFLAGRPQEQVAEAVKTA